MVKLITKPKKIEKEPDEFISLTQRVWSGISENPTRAATIAGGLVGVVLLVILGLFFKERSEQKRLVALAQTVEQYRTAESASPDTGTQEESLRQLADRHAGSVVGGQALYFLAGHLAGRGDYAGAVEAYGRVRKKYAGNGNLAQAAAVGLAYCYKMTGNHEEAIRVFQEIIDQDTIPAPRTQIELELGGIFQKQGRTEEAAASYRALVERDPESEWGKEAARRLSGIEGG